MLTFKKLFYLPTRSKYKEIKNFPLILTSSLKICNHMQHLPVSVGPETSYRKAMTL